MKCIEVSAAVIVKDRKVFATQRGYGDFKDGWEFPGGKLEKGESASHAVIREIREELATEIRIERFLGTIEHDYPEFHLIMHIFITSVVNGHLELLEHENAAWVDLDTIDTLAWLPSDCKVVALLKADADAHGGKLGI